METRSALSRPLFVKEGFHFKAVGMLTGRGGSVVELVVTNGVEIKPESSGRRIEL